MNYSPLIIDTLNSYMIEFPGYSMGDILYSCLSQLNKGEPNIRKSDLREISTEQFYSLLNKSVTNERR